MKDLYLATYSYGLLNLTHREMADTALELGFQGIEYLNPLNWTIAQIIRETGIKVIDTMEVASPDGTVSDPDLLHELGVQYIAGTGIVSFGNHQQALWAAERMNKAGKQIAELGFKLYYHNHTHEWRMDYGEYLMETFLKNTDPDYVCLQMDIGWAACAGVEPVAFVKKYPGRVELMHVKASTGVLGPEGVDFMAPSADGDGSGQLPPLDKVESGPPSALPTGMKEAMAKIKAVSGAMKDCNIDYGELMAAAEVNGCKAFILERDAQYVPDPIQCIQEDILELRRFW